MSQINVDKTLKIPAPDKEKFTTVVHSEFIQFYAKNKKDIPTVFAKLKADADGYKVYLKEEMPSRLHYGAKDDCFNRIGDIILIADPPLVFSSSSRKPKPGAHGYDNEVADMRGIFYGWGPAFKTGKVLNHIRNVDVYPIVTEILGLNISDCIDGNTRISKKVLKQ